MKVIGFSSGVVGHDSNVDRMVRAIMAETDCETEFVKLNDINYSACKGCVALCAGPQVCMLDDDLKPYCQKVKDADAVVLGGAVHFSTVNAAMVSFLSRLWAFHHVTIPIKNKPFVLALSGGSGGIANSAPDDFRKHVELYQVNLLDVVVYASQIPPCYSCGRHTECNIGGAYMMWGEKARTLEITPELFRKWEDDPESVSAVKAAGKKLSDALSN